MTKYTFKTIVAPEEVRADFTVLRDRLNSSDKELMQAFWNFAMSNISAIEDEVKHLQEQAALAKSAKQEMKAAAKLKEKAPKAKKEKVAAKKAPKKKAKKADKVTKVATIVDDEGDIETVVVDGTR
jgi:peptidoglycan hydrolase CwlO-like protein